MSLPNDIHHQARKAAGKAWATAVELNELAVDAALINLGDVKTAFDLQFVARLDEHINTIAASTGEKRKAVDDGNNPRQPRQASAPVLELRVAVGELVDDVLGGEEDDVQWCFWTASRLHDVRDLINTWLEVYHVAPRNVLCEFQRSSSPFADADTDDDERGPYSSADDDDDYLSPLSTSASPPAALAAPTLLSDSSPASSPRDDLDSSSDMDLSSPPSSPGLELADDVNEPRVLRTLDELASFVSEPTQGLANLDIDVPAADAIAGLLTHISTALASWKYLTVTYDQSLSAKDLHALRPATKDLSGLPAENVVHAHYDVPGADAFPVSPLSPLCARVGGYLDALRTTAAYRGPYRFVDWLDVLDSDGARLALHLEVATLKTIAPNAQVLTIRAALTDAHTVDLGRTLQAFALDQRTGDENWPMARLERTLRNLRAKQVPVVAVRAPLAGTIAAALAHGFGRAQDENAMAVVAFLENRNVRRLSLASKAESRAHWVLDDVTPASVVELVASRAWVTFQELCVSNRLSDGYIDALYKASPRALEVLTVFIADDAPDPADGNFLAPVEAQGWICRKLGTLVLTASAPASLASRLLPQVDICVGKRPTVPAFDIARFIDRNEVARAGFRIIMRGVEFAGGLAEARKVLAGVTIIPDRDDL